MKGQHDTAYVMLAVGLLLRLRSLLQQSNAYGNCQCRSVSSVLLLDKGTTGQQALHHCFSNGLHTPCSVLGAPCSCLVPAGSAWDSEVEVAAFAKAVDSAIGKVRGSLVSELLSGAEKQVRALTGSSVMELLASCTAGVWPRMHEASANALQTAEEGLQKVRVECLGPCASWCWARCSTEVVNGEEQVDTLSHSTSTGDAAGSALVNAVAQELEARVSSGQAESCICTIIRFLYPAIIVPAACSFCRTLERAHVRAHTWRVPVCLSPCSPWLAMPFNLQRPLPYMRLWLHVRVGGLTRWCAMQHSHASHA